MATSKIPQQIDTFIPFAINENGIKYINIIGIVYVTFIGNNNMDIPKGVWTTIYTLPSKYRPKNDFIASVAFNSSGNMLGLCQVKAGTGNIDVFQQITETVKNIWGFISFPAATWR